jgi:cytochrome P450 / NADPH-cytochrome P450 reductase
MVRASPPSAVSSSSAPSSLAANPDRQLPKAILFVGCRSATKDRLYADEMDDWANLGAVDARYAFSNEKDHSAGCAYVAERMVQSRDDVVDLWRSGARVYICGSRSFAESLYPAAMSIFEQRDGRHSGQAPLEDIRERFQRALQERIVSDIFD